MGFSNMVEQDAATIFFNTDEFAEQITHWPEGNGDASATITAVFIPEESRRELQRGQEIVRPAVVWVDDNLTITNKDVFIINSVAYQVLRFDAIEYGARRVEVQRNDRDHTTRPGAAQLL